MHIQRNQPPVPTKGLIPFSFDKKQKDDEEQDWGMNPNPDGWEPNYKLMGVCAAGGVCSGVSLGFLGGAYFGIHPLPLILAGSLAGAYVGGAIGLAFAQRNPD
ncbi:MAG: hypothetical protein J0I12_16080 [Candidatus Eremiobacteraeota bacterium]|nr:hypothetical protein [Candidatus Eremiobacteraeota bacterium]